MILVSGATGNVGQHLVGQLLDKGAEVRALVRDEQKVAHLGNSVERAVGDLDRPETLAAAMQGIDQLYFVTPDTQQVINLLEAAKRAGVSHVVKQSTIEADRSVGPGKWHREQEELIEASGLAWTFLRPTMLMVNTIEWWSATIKSQSAVYFPGGKGKVPPVDPRDVADVAGKVLTFPGYEGQIYELTGPEALTIGEMVHILETVLGRRIRYVNVPAFLAAIWLRRFGLPRFLVKGLMETLGALRRNEYAYVTDAVERVGRHRPRSFEAWCRDHIAAFQ
ncbi:MAG: SDR family oxidoreductase [Chloroflexi bacterium]|nr:SDR family oxidoreductase [Chloroflexota bacterium]MCI0576546.1 SDR family oxidoreductase [Chloroflexota bacterium]MCI0646677.1 SDR family oxidoreductase [Chloroflexota bacterium]MCI0727536.1 SDR family oxidoreductase [Chloroflexota bacterium]